MQFKLRSEFQPTGDQPEAIASIVNDLNLGVRNSVLLGVTGSGKTFTVANIIKEVSRPTLVLCHNKTLAAQLYQEFKNFFPDNAVEYYVSYYDYYQPEAYLPASGTYIEKDLSINDEIEKKRLSTTSTLLTGRRDVIVVASVSCIYGIGNPEDFKATSIPISVGDRISPRMLMERLVEAFYTRVDKELTSSTFRANGDSVDVMSSYGEFCYKISFIDREVESITTIDPISGARGDSTSSVTLFPANLFVTTKERVERALVKINTDMIQQCAEFESRGQMVESQRLKQRVECDIEMIKEIGYCSGIENYSRYFDNRKPGDPPFCLLNYFPSDFLTVIDESHVTLPQISGMSGGDRARKQNLVDYGWRLDAAKDNRPLTFAEFTDYTGQRIFVSATPGNLELDFTQGKYTEQLIRPTGLLDPVLKMVRAANPVDDLIDRIREVIARNNNEKILVAVITKRLAEELSRHCEMLGIRNRYMHSDIDTLERVKILKEFKEGEFDLLIGINLLREGLDLPDVALVAIMDADKEGFLRSETAITQIAGRAARNTRGLTLLYGGLSRAIALAIIKSNRHRLIQSRYNLKHKQLPKGVRRSGTSNNELLSTLPTEETMRMEVRIAEQHYQPKVASTTKPKSGSKITPSKEISTDITQKSVQPIAAERPGSYSSSSGKGSIRNRNANSDIAPPPAPKRVPKREVESSTKIDNERPINKEYSKPIAASSSRPDDLPPLEYITAANANSIDLDEQIERTKIAMEAAAKALDFTAAVRLRDRMYELIKLRNTVPQSKRHMLFRK